MPRKPTESSNYPSRYSPSKYVTAMQYIIELVCEKYARKQDKDLPLQFWKQDEWAKYYVSQTRAVSKLLKAYDERAILNAIYKKGLFSLRPAWVTKVIEVEQKLLGQQKEANALRAKESNDTLNRVEDIVIKIEKSRKPFKSGISKMIDLDGEI